MGVAVLQGVDDAVAHVVADDLLAQAPHGGVHGGKLHQDVRAVLVVLDHDLDVPEMPDGPGYPVELPLFFLRAVVMPVPACFGFVHGGWERLFVKGRCRAASALSYVPCLRNARGGSGPEHGNKA